MRLTLWHPDMVNCLLEHLEKYKGEKGLYGTNKQAAYKHAAETLNEAFPQYPMTPSQVSGKLNMLSLRERRSTQTGGALKDLLLKGRCVLRAPYSDTPKLSASEEAAPHGHQDAESTSLDKSREQPEVGAPRGTGRVNEHDQRSRNVFFPSLTDRNMRESSSDVLGCAYTVSLPSQGQGI